jgi:hypothetical protein
VNRLTVEVRYKPLSPWAAMALCMGWLAFGLAVGFAMIPVLAPFGLGIGLLSWLVGGFVFIYVPFLIVSFYREGGLLLLSRDGLVFPPACF